MGIYLQNLRQLEVFYLNKKNQNSLLKHKELLKFVLKVNIIADINILISFQNIL